MKRQLLFVLAVIALVTPLPLSAHHGWGGNEDKESEITGVVSSPVSLAGPHATMKIKVGPQIWDLTLAPPNRTSAAGVTEKTFPVGATVAIHGHRNKDPKKFEMKTERITYNGKVYNVYPDRE